MYHQNIKAAFYQLERLNVLKTNMHAVFCLLFCYTLSLFHQNDDLYMCYDTQNNTPVHVCEKAKALQYFIYNA